MRLLRRPAAAAAALLAASALVAGCGAEPRASDRTTIDSVVLERGVVVGADRDRGPGVRALSARTTRTVESFQRDAVGTLFGDGGENTFTPYLNGFKPIGGLRETVYAGDRLGWLVRDRSDPAPPPAAVVGLFPAPFSTRFTERRRMLPSRVECIDVRSAGCEQTTESLLEAGVRPGGTAEVKDMSQRDVIRVLVGPWSQLRPELTGRLASALAVERQAEANGYGFQIADGGRRLVPAAPFGEAATAAPLGAGSGALLAGRDRFGVPWWIITGTDEAGVERAAGALTEDQLLGRVAAIVPPA